MSATPAAMNTSPSPAPVMKKAPATSVSYDDIEKISRCSSLLDFSRERSYWLHKRNVQSQGLDIRLMKVNKETEEKLVRKSTTRMLKEYDSASWGSSLYQMGVFGLMGFCLVGTCGTLYLGCTRNRLFLGVVPVGAAMTWRLWTVLEDAWAYQRYVDNAARLRNERRANPMQSVVKRRIKATDTASSGSVEESSLSDENLMLTETKDGVHGTTVKF